MNLKTKTLLVALVLAVVAWGYHAYSTSQVTPDDQSNAGTIIEAPSTNSINSVATPNQPVITTPAVEVKAGPIEEKHVEDPTKAENNGEVLTNPEGE